MKLKGWKKLEKRINKLVDHIEGGIKVKLSSADECVIRKRKIYFSVLRISEQDECFMKNLRKQFPDAPKRSAYLYSLLHEIGHINTSELLENEDKQLREKLMASGDNEQYFLLPAEKAATEWAVNYANNNRFMVMVVDRKIAKAMEKFLDKNITE